MISFCDNSNAATDKMVTIKADIKERLMKFSADIDVDATLEHIINASCKKHMVRQQTRAVQRVSFR